MYGTNLFKSSTNHLLLRKIKDVYFRIIILFIASSLLFSCKSTISIEEEEELVSCSKSDLNISKQDNIISNDATNLVVWKGNYSDNLATIHYTSSAGLYGETETYNFVFSKQENCLKVARAYKYYDGKNDDISAITEFQITDLQIQDWEKDKKFSGLITYTDPHDKNTYSKKFWVEFTENDKVEPPTNFIFFNDCFGSKLPLEIDMNNDNLIDFKLDYEILKDEGNKPKYDRYGIKLISTSASQNKILSPEKNQGPYSVLYEPPFTSENKRQYFNGVKNELDVFYEFEEPYQKYNFFLNNKLTYKPFFENNIDDYYIVSMTIDDKLYYGWIKLTFNSKNCEVQIVDTYLHPIANEHISVK